MRATLDDLIGSWRLLRWRRVTADGAETAPHSAGNRGRIVYTADGHMAAFLMHPEWPATGEPQGGSLAYSGRYSVDGEVVRHEVDLATLRSMIGRTLIRTATLEGAMLRLEAEDEPGVIHRLDWEREA